MGEMLSWGGLLHAIVQVAEEHLGALAIARGEQEAFLFDGKHNAQIRKRASDFLSHVSKKHNFQYKLSMENLCNTD